MTARMYAFLKRSCQIIIVMSVFKFLCFKCETDISICDCGVFRKCDVDPVLCNKCKNYFYENKLRYFCLCDTSDHCPFGEYCEEYRCIPKRSSGVSCKTEEECMNGLRCTNNRCSLQGEPPRNCTGAVNCNTREQCIDHVCMKPAKYGDGCSFDSDCTKGLQCLSQTCMRKTKLRRACTWSQECSSSVKNAICTADPYLFEKMQCACPEGHRYIKEKSICQSEGGTALQIYRVFLTLLLIILVFTYVTLFACVIRQCVFHRSRRHPAQLGVRISNSSYVRRTRSVGSEPPPFEEPPTYEEAYESITKGLGLPPAYPQNSMVGVQFELESPVRSLNESCTTEEQQSSEEQQVGGIQNRAFVHD